MLLLRVLQDALGAEHVSVLHAVEFDLLLRVSIAVLDLTLGHLTGAQGWIGRCGHGQSRQNLVVHGQVVWVHLVVRFVVWALNHAVLGQLADTLTAERVTTRQ